MSQENIKEFFRRRAVGDIRRMNPRQFRSVENMVRYIWEDMDPQADAVQSMVRLTPGRFYRGGQTGDRASRLNLKHGEVLKLKVPNTIKEALHKQHEPLELRVSAFDSLNKLPGGGVQHIGYAWRPVHWQDKRLRVIPFATIPEMIKRYCYVVHTGPRPVERYEAARSLIEGIDIVASVPSKRKRIERYRPTLYHFPVKDHPQAAVYSWSLHYGYSSHEPKHGKYYNVRYTFLDSRIGSDFVGFGSVEGAAYLMGVREEIRKLNLAPLKWSPFSLISRKMAEFYNKCFNNAITMDTTLKSRHKLRWLHLDELSRLMAVAIREYGPQQMIWDAERDNWPSSYDWSIGLRAGQPGSKKT